MEGIIKFFKRVTGLTPTPDQVKFLKALADINIKKIAVSSGRRCGKTLCVAIGCLWFVFIYAPAYRRQIKILLISAQDNEIYEYMGEFFSKKGHEKYRDEIVKEGRDGPIPVKGFDLKSGCKVWARGATGGQIRGKGADIVIIDEACSIKDKIITVAMGTFQGSIYKMALTSTVHDTKSIFMDICENHEEKGYEYFTWSEEDCPWIPKALIKMKRDSMTKQEFMVEVEGKIPPLSERSLFPHKNVKKCLVDHIISEGGEKEAGLDFGYSVGKTVITITERIGYRRKLLFQKSWSKTPIEECYKEIKNICERYKVTIIKADNKPPEYPKFLGKKLGSIPIVYLDMTFHKAPMLGQLVRRVRQGYLEISTKQVALIIQLKKYRKKKRAGDDLVDSLAMSCYESNFKPISRGKIIISKF